MGGFREPMQPATITPSNETGGPDIRVPSGVPQPKVARSRHVQLVFLVYVGLAACAFSFWRYAERHPMSGDEPHYLVMADGLVHHGVLEQTVPYTEEFRERNIYAGGLAAVDAVPSPENAHVIRGPHGLYNVHNIGLPLLVAGPYWLGGELWAKWALLFLSSLIVFVGWRISSLFSSDETARTWSLLAIVAGLPYIPASTQIYPDLLAGIIALAVVYWLITLKESQSLPRAVAYVALASFLPWLQIKFAAASAVLVLGAAIRMLTRRWSIGRIAVVLSPFVLSIGLLAFYNHYAFGKLGGPYESSALELSAQSLMVLIGLHLDQNQGFLLQNPILFAGVASVFVLFRYDRLVGWIWLVAYGALIVPNALHPVWYGGWSFSGRFGWSAAAFFALPTLLGLLRLHAARPRWFYGVIAAGLTIQAYFYLVYVLFPINFHRRHPATWLDSYSILHTPLNRWLPAFYDLGWAFRSPTNLAFLAIVLLLLLWSLRAFPSRLLLGGALLLLVLGWVLPAPRPEPITFGANELFGSVGSVVGESRIAEEGRDSPGYLTYGPYLYLRKTDGGYRASLQYQSSGWPYQRVGVLQVVSSDERLIVGAIPIMGTLGRTEKISVDFQAQRWESLPYEFRTHWSGASSLKVEKVVLDRL